MEASEEKPRFRVLARHNPGFDGVFVNGRHWKSTAWTNDVELTAAELAKLKADYRLNVELMPDVSQAVLDSELIDAGVIANQLRTENEQHKARLAKAEKAIIDLQLELGTAQAKLRIVGGSQTGRENEEMQSMRDALEASNRRVDAANALKEGVEEELAEAKREIERLKRELEGAPPATGQLPEEEPAAPRGRRGR